MGGQRGQGGIETKLLCESKSFAHGFAGLDACQVPVSLKNCTILITSAHSHIKTWGGHRLTRLTMPSHQHSLAPTCTKSDSHLRHSDMLALDYYSVFMHLGSLLLHVRLKSVLHVSNIKSQQNIRFRPLMPTSDSNFSQPLSLASSWSYSCRRNARHSGLIWKSLIVQTWRAYAAATVSWPREHPPAHS